MSDKLLYFNDRVRNKEYYDISKYASRPSVPVESEIKFFNDETGEMIWEPLHNKTLIAGSALVAMKLFNLNHNVLDNTPTYDVVLGLDEATTNTNHYPTMAIKDNDGNIVGEVQDETQRVISGFAIGQGGAGLDISDVFQVPYASWITPDNLVPFRYPLTSADDVDEAMYIGKKSLGTLANGQNRTAYYFKRFSNTPNLVQNYTSTIGTFTDSVSSATVYSNVASADKAQSYVEIHLKITKEDVR